MQVGISPGAGAGSPDTAVCDAASSSTTRCPRHIQQLHIKEASMKTGLCILAVLVLTSSAADAYVRRTIGGGHVVRGHGVYSGRYAGGFHRYGYLGHPVARGAAIAGTAALAATAATGWGYNQPYYSGGYY